MGFIYFTNYLSYLYSLDFIIFV